MIRNPYLSNPVTEAVSSYRMNDNGKVVVSSMIAQVVSSMLQSSYQQSESSYRQQDWDHMYDTLEDMMKAISNSPENMSIWNNLSTIKRRQLFIDLFNQTGLSHLVPLLLVELDKYFPC